MRRSAVCAHSVQPYELVQCRQGGRNLWWRGPAVRQQGHEGMCSARVRAVVESGLAFELESGFVHLPAGRAMNLRTLAEHFHERVDAALHLALRPLRVACSDK